MLEHGKKFPNYCIYSSNKCCYHFQIEIFLHNFDVLMFNDNVLPH